MVVLHAILVLIALKCCVNCVPSKKIRRHQDDFNQCDDGQHGISIDLHGDLDWKCNEDSKWDVKEYGTPSYKCYKEERAFHVCIDRTIDNLYASDIPHSGPHRKVWAQYGEYDYLPPGRYVHNLEHGGVVFMYHPCAPTEMVNKLRKVATTCLYRYIMTAFRNLTQEYPFAVITYGCIYRTAKIDSQSIKEWIRNQFGKSPESDVFGNGAYTAGLLVPSVESTENSRNKSLFCVDGPEDDLVVQEDDLVVQEDDMEDYIPTTADDNLITVPEENIENSTILDLNVAKNTKFHEYPTEVAITMRSKSTTSDVSSEETVTDMQLPSTNDGTDTFWVLSALVLLVFATFTGLCLMKLWTSPRNGKTSISRIWSDSHGMDSFSVAAIVRKLPGALRRNRNVDAKLYHRIDAAELSSEDEKL